ncbi:riboflavin biosynthesis protein RibD [Ensifer adhaerens]|uniref:Riboflavin biosynthesis protein RibD n=1 Tax=Ensifer adhaerens TaxID=106592 RepID=A0A0L8BTQ0_ENSAD|nr:dihydrofolate reductase family protein [Ensifer adhaerens]KOF17925.1 riboflavin biosynthesis protein RibD [Ensifer adhaerens]
MRKVIMWDMVSVDGFFEAPDHDISWFVFEDELAAYIGETQLEADTLLFGRVTYEMMASYWPGAEGDIATFMNGVEKYVFSRSLKTGDWHNTTLVSGDAVAEVERLKAQQGGTIFIFGSADFAAELVEKGLVDEYRLGINPVLLGGGVPLFKPLPKRTPLKLTHTRPLKSGVVILHYQPQPDA